MKYFYLIAIVFFALSCGTTSTKAKVKSITISDSSIALKDTSTKVDSVLWVEQKIEFNDIPKKRELKVDLIYFRDKYLLNYTEINSQEQKVYVLDRFTCENKYKLILKKKSTVKYGKVENIFPVLNLRAYQYKDSTQCANALNNWLNCFGNDCNTVIRNEKTTIKSTPGFYIINPNSIICVDYQLEHAENNWKDVIGHLKKLFSTKESTYIMVEPHGKLTWE